ncbi:SLATT domain-containing protein [Thalassospira marina]|uniref:SMODS and SLOG-associating 2TM effector domain-containing protein n=1 Tax=Thalassospira marina TaxID=2048283 RepID=A0ABM6QD52_9PROT|nr:hypothetical protein CSC3H3_18420 [Thalassospira marina]
MPSNIAPYDTKHNDVERIKTNIWITYKCRILAYERISKYNLHSQVLLAVYTLPIIFISIIDLKFQGNDKQSLITIFFSISVLVASIFIYSQNFSGRMEKSKENYIKLQYIHEHINEQTYPDYLKEYHNIISSYDNHKEIDYLHFLKQQLEKGEIEKKHENFLSKNRNQISAYQLLYRSTIFTLYLLPTSAIAYIFYTIISHK